MEAAATHDIHNRSRNRKQERRPPPPSRRWTQNNNAQQQQQRWRPNNSSNSNNRDYGNAQNYHDGNNDNGDDYEGADDESDDYSADHERLTDSLRGLCSSRNLVESSAGTRKRRRVMRDLDAMLRAWSESLLPGSSSYAENMIRGHDDNNSDDICSLLSFGSYRLGVHTPDADVDCLVLAPPHVTREDFFGSWVDVLRGDDRVAELHPVAGAYTPVIKFEMDEVKIDLIFARVNNSKWLTEQRAKIMARQRQRQRSTSTSSAHIGAEGEVGGGGEGTATTQRKKDEDEEERVEMTVDDTVLVGLDETSVRSVNGVRVAQFLMDMVSSSGNDGCVDDRRLDDFRLTLRVVKEWARVHGLYSNVLGFLGGVNWAILVCWICKRNPDAPASKLLQLFFQTFANWKWPNPVVLLSKQEQNNQPPPRGVKPLAVWDPNENYRDAKHMMPIITPCYPQMNSSYNVGEPQLRRLRDELWRASKLSNDVLAERKAWEVLFEGNDFFKQHANYLQVEIVGTNEDEFRSWFGLCESRMRVLIAGLESPTAGVRAYPFAKFFHRRDEGNDNGNYVSSFFVALRFAHSAKRVDLGPLVEDYLQIINSWEGRGYGMDLTIRLVLKKNLPSFVFATDDVVDGATNPVAEIPSKSNNARMKDVAKVISNDYVDKEADTPIPSSSRKKPMGESETAPSSNGSPLKRTRII